MLFAVNGVAIEPDGSNGASGFSCGSGLGAIASQLHDNGCATQNWSWAPAFKTATSPTTTAKIESGLGGNAMILLTTGFDHIYRCAIGNMRTGGNNFGSVPCL